MKMKFGRSKKILGLLCCVLVLFPNYVLAASIPGLANTVIPKIAPPAPVPSLPNKGGPQITIPGLNSQTIGSPPPNQLPVLKNPSASIPGVSTIDTDTSQSKETIRQTQSKVIIDWASFDIGANAWVDFDQKGNSSWAALNRIWDKDPSYIFGRLTAPGQIYLINQNGILFGPGSKMNVGSLTASALNISNTNFLNNLFQFKHENYRLADDPNAILDPLATVSNFGEISTGDNGSVFLMSPRVENGGTISASIGQIGLVAGTGVQLVPPNQDDLSRMGNSYVIVDKSSYANPPSATADPGQTFGKAVNQEGGKLYADGGMVGMYANNVENWGIIRSTTAFKNRKGQVELKAANKVTTGPSSLISLPVDDSIDPETGKVRTVSDTFDIAPTVFIGGLDELEYGSLLSFRRSNGIELRGSITAPSGDVRVMARERVYLDAGSRIDVSGVVVEMPPQLITGKLTSTELRDAYGQKTGIVPGLKIVTTPLTGSSIGDISGWILTQDRTALERSIGGSMRKVARTINGIETWSYVTDTGNINISAETGDIVVREGAVLDFSGGAIHYAGGLVDSTKLLAGNKIYDISNAPLYLRYDKVLGEYTKTYTRFGIREKYTGLYSGGANPLKSYVEGYTVGGDAGKLFLSAPKIVLDGQLNGGVTQGAYQNTWTMAGSFSSMDDYDGALVLSKARGLEAPRPGTVTIGGLAAAAGNPTSVSIVSETKPLPEGFLSSTSLAPTSPTEISAAVLNGANIGSLSLTADLTISTAQDVKLNLQAGGSFSAQARRIEHKGEIRVPGGSISMDIGQNLTSHTDINGNIRTPSDGYVEIAGGERIVLEPTSRLDVSGERIDNSMVGKTGQASMRFGQTTGGRISIRDKTDEGSGVFIETGAVVDVSGGYAIDQKGKVTGGNAGLLSIQGSNILLAGDLRGYALPDLNGKILGGSITLASKEIHVFDHHSTVTDPVANAFYLADNRFDHTGFTQVALTSIDDLVIHENAHMSTSLTRLNNPTSDEQGGAAPIAQGVSGIDNAVPSRPDLIRLEDSMAFTAGPSSFAANAGIAFDGNDPHYAGNLRQTTISDAHLTILPGAVIRTAPGGSSVTRIANDVAVNPLPVKTQISLSAPTVDVAGTLLSPGGTISATATSGDLLVRSGAQILAPGYNKPDFGSTPKGFSTNYQPVNGGSVALVASSNLMVDSSSLIDISGSDAVETRMKSADGSIVSFQEAGNPGSLSLTYRTLAWSPGPDNVRAYAKLPWIQGAGLAIGMATIDTGLDVRAEHIRKYIEMGFDDLTFRSRNSLVFHEPMDFTLGRKLTLDAPIIRSSENSVTALSAPWVVLTNSYYPQPSSATPVASGAKFILSGQWIDVIGAVNFSGFQGVSLKASRDIRVSEASYSLNNTDMLGGKLTTGGDLILDADRIYPTNLYSYADGSKVYPNISSDFILHADLKATIRHTGAYGQTISSHSDEPIYSAGGSLTVEGLKGIEVENGYLAAPMGGITLTTAVNGEAPAPQSRIYLSSGSVLTTAGRVGVSYGGIDSSNIWVTQDKRSRLDTGLDSESTKIFSPDTLPQKKVTLNADEVIAMKGSLIDISGGGSVFAYKFQPGIQGSVDPLTKANRYIVFQDNGFQVPGQAVYLQGGGGLSQGMYTLLPLDANNPQNARYAFMPGAYILDLQSGATLPGNMSMSKDGYPLTTGYSAVSDTAIRGTRPKIYSVRSATDVLQMEGNYILPSLVSGDGGNIGIAGSTVVLGGSLKGEALQGYQGGKISLSAANIIVQSSATSALPQGLGFDTGFDSNPELLAFKNKLTMSADSVSGKGFSALSLGDKDSTSTVTIESGMAGAPTTMSASVISLAAKDKINIQTNTQLNALTTKDKDSGEGVINLTTPGILFVDTGANVHATHNISLGVNNVDHIQGSLQVDRSAITLKNNAITFGSGTKESGYVGLYLTPDAWKSFTGYEDITLQSGYTDSTNKYVSNEIRFNDLNSFDLSATSSLTLDASRIGLNVNGASVTVTAPTVNLRNSGSNTPTQNTNLANSGTFTANASTQINVGGGDVLFGGFTNINLNSRNDLTLVGKGSLTTGNADLNISAARVTTAGTTRTVSNADSTTTTSLTAPNFIVNAGTGAIRMTASGVTPATSPVPGGLLEIDARRIELATVLQSDGGTVKLATKGASGLSDDGIFLNNGGQILARGTDAAPGGHVTLATHYIDSSGNAQSGKIILETGSKIDISAGTQEDAGLVSLSAPIGGVTLGGTIVGVAQGNGKGGSFILDTNTIGDITAWNDKLTAKSDSQGNVISGGFTESLDLRARTGNIEIPSGQTLQARRVKLTADDSAANGGNINLSGTIDSSTPDGSGRVQLYTQNNLNVNSGGWIKAQGTNAGAKGGDVLLSSSTGSINLNTGGTIDLSGGNGGTGGTLYLRALRNGNDVKINLDGTLNGAKTVYAEAVQRYTGSSFDPVWLTDATTYYNSNTAVARLEGKAPSGAATFHLLPGIEVDSSGDINVQTELDFSSLANARYQTQHDLDVGKTVMEPGVLTLRAGGNINIGQNLVDHPTLVENLTSSQAQSSWGFNLVAGAGLDSANYMAVNKAGTGSLNIANNQVVYTENAPIRFASGGDTVIGLGLSAGYMVNQTMPYALASYGGSIQGNVGQDLIINGGAIQAAIGDINIDVGRDLQLNYASGSLGSVRTTGILPMVLDPNQGRYVPAAFGGDPRDPVPIDPLGRTLTQSDPNGTFYWRYDSGGNITLDVGRFAGLSNLGQWVTAQDKNAWDNFNAIKVTLPNRQVRQYGLFSASFETSATTKPTAGLATLGGGDLFVRTGSDFLAQAGTFGAGDLKIYSGGDIRGRFLNRDGRGELHAMGNFGSAYERQQIELFDSRMNVTALGEIQIGAVLNPSLASNGVDSYRNTSFVYNTYTKDTSLSLKAGTDVAIDGRSPKTDGISPLYKSESSADDMKRLPNERILPPTVKIDAGGNILILNDFTLASSPEGNLSLRAGGAITGDYIDAGQVKTAKILMSDIAPENWFGLFYIGSSSSEQQGGWINLRTINNHGLYQPVGGTWLLTDSVHQRDGQAVKIHADTDIRNLGLILPKKAEVSAGRDILDITYEGQNINPADVSKIQAGRNIAMKYIKASDTSNPTDQLSHDGLIQGGPGVFFVQAGGSIDLGSLKDGIQAAGNGNNPVLGMDKSDLVVVSGYTSDKSAADIGDFFSNLRTAGDDYAQLMAKGKLSDAAALLQKTRDETIKPFLGTPSSAGDVNMTSSQISTSIGQSDIFVIASGNLNLGKTALPLSSTVNRKTGITTAGGGAINIFAERDINVNESRIMTFYGGDITVWSDEGSINAGRGSRTAVSASPPRQIIINGAVVWVFSPPAIGSGIRAVTYGDNPPPPGNIHLFAPSGIIDAGEAEISGGRVVVAATQVLNAQNISFSAGSVGVPSSTPSQAATGIGALTGTSSLKETSKMTEQATSLAPARTEAVKAMEEVIARWVNVEVIGFEEN